MLAIIALNPYPLAPWVLSGCAAPGPCNEDLNSLYSLTWLKRVSRNSSLQLARQKELSSWDIFQRNPSAFLGPPLKPILPYSPGNPDFLLPAERTCLRERQVLGQFPCIKRWLRCPWTQLWSGQAAPQLPPSEGRPKSCSVPWGEGHFKASLCSEKINPGANKPVRSHRNAFKC